jgi:hypothetical protein
MSTPIFAAKGAATARAIASCCSSRRTTAPAIEDEFRRRAIAGASENPMTRAELEAIMPDGRRLPGERRDALWVLVHNNADNRESGRPVSSYVGRSATRNRRNRHVERQEDRSARKSSPRGSTAVSGKLERVTPEMADAELAHTGGSPARRLAAAADVRIDQPELKLFDEPGGAGAKDQAASLEHDARMAAAPERASSPPSRRLERNRQRPRQHGNSRARPASRSRPSSDEIRRRSAPRASASAIITSP